MHGRLILLALLISIVTPMCFAQSYGNLDDCSVCVKRQWQSGFSVGDDSGSITLAFCVPEARGSYGNCETYDVDDTHQGCRTGPSFVSYGNCELGIAPLPGYPIDPFRNWPNLIRLPGQQMKDFLARLRVYV